MPEEEKLYIVERRLCVVHRNGSCPSATGLDQIPVTRNQCLVYKLPSCGQCWPSIKEYDLLVHGVGSSLVLLG